MKRLAVLVCFLVSIPLLADDSPLKGARTIFINTGDVHVKRDIQLALKHELPQVRVVSRAKDADLIVDFVGREGGNQITYVTGMTQAAGSTSTPGANDVRVAVPGEASTYDPGHIVATVRHGDATTLVIHEGMPSPFFPNQFAARFITAWRAANN